MLSVLRTYFIFCLAALSATAFASPLTPDITTPNFFPYNYGFTPFVSLSYGSGTAKQQASTSVDLPPGSFNFSGSNTHSVNLMGLTAGVEKDFDGSRFGLLGWQLGVSIQQYTGMTGTGNAVQGIPDAFSHFSYSYDIKSFAWMLGNKFFGTFARRYHPYGFIGIGQTRNTTSNYTTTPQDRDTDVPANFASKSTVSMLYQWGIGLDADITADWKVGLGFRYTDLGKVSLGSGSVNDQPLPVAELSQSHLKNQSVLIEVSYAF